MQSELVSLSKNASGKCRLEKENHSIKEYETVFVFYVCFNANIEIKKYFAIIVSKYFLLFQILKILFALNFTISI